MHHGRSDPSPHTRSPIGAPFPMLPSQPTHKNPYAGLTLKEYFNLADSKPQLDNIDEEMSSQASAGTPCFGGEATNQNNHLNPDRGHRRNRNKTEMEELGGCQEEGFRGNQKMATLSLQEFGLSQKQAVKLPAIHEHRQKDSSRQGLKDTKELKPTEKREAVGLNLALFARKQQVGRGVGRSIINARRGIRSRVTSTSFYHMNLREKERQRVKTEEEVEYGLEKSFVITRYGGMLTRSHKHADDMGGLKKYQNSFKLTKH